MLENLVGTVTARTLLLYARSWQKYVDFCEEQGLELVSAGSILAWRSQLVAAGYGPNTINSDLSAIKSLFKGSLAAGLVTVETYTQVRAVASVSTRALRDRLRPGKDLLDDALVLSMIDKQPGDLAGLRNRAMLYVLGTTGVRIDELVNMRLDECNIQTMDFVVRGKTDVRPRKIPVAQATGKAIVQWIYARDFSSLWMFNSFIGRSLRMQDKPITKQGAYNMIVESGKSVGVNISPHDFRRYVATKVAADNIIEAKELLGHSSILTTQRYVKRANLPSVEWFG